MAERSELIVELKRGEIILHKENHSHFVGFLQNRNNSNISIYTIIVFAIVSQVFSYPLVSFKYTEALYVNL